MTRTADHPGRRAGARDRYRQGHRAYFLLGMGVAEVSERVAYPSGRSGSGTAARSTPRRPSGSSATTCFRCSTAGRWPGAGPEGRPGSGWCGYSARRRRSASSRSGRRGGRYGAGAAGVVVRAGRGTGRGPWRARGGADLALDTTDRSGPGAGSSRGAAAGPPSWPGRLPESLTVRKPAGTSSAAQEPLPCAAPALSIRTTCATGQGTSGRSPRRRTATDHLVRTRRPPPAPCRWSSRSHRTADRNRL